MLEPVTGTGDSPVSALAATAGTDRVQKKDAKDTARLDALLKLARSRYKSVFESEGTLRAQQLEDKRFRAGQQWDETVKAKRKKAQRPCLTVNRIPQFINQITGAQRSNRQDIQVNAVDDFGDPDVADVFAGLIKHIESISHSDDAYDTGGDDQVCMGRGYIRLITEPCYDDSFDLEIKIKRVRNAHSVYYDTRCQELDYSDAYFAFVRADYPKEEFEYQFDADADEFESDEWAGAMGDDVRLWWDGDAVTVVEYFYVEHEDYVLCRLSDGRDMDEESATKAILESIEEIKPLIEQAEMDAAQGIPVDPAQLPKPIEIVKQRKAKRRVVKWAKLCGTRVLKEGRWPGKWIPIIPVIGYEIDLDGKVDYRGVVRDARDQQRLYNFHVSSLVEAVGMAPRAPWVIAKGQLESFEKIWKTANTEPHAFLPYNPISSGGTYAPAPQRQSFEPAIQAIVIALQQADNDLKATTGFYDASLGERGPEQSGKAILARQKQGEIGSVHFMTGMSRARWAIGRQLIDLIPKVYDVARVVRILGNDGKQRTVMVHGGKQDSVPTSLPNGVKQVYDLGVGRYDVRVSEGPSSETRRQESVEMMTAAIQANPELMQLIGDLYFSAMDDPKMRQIAERLKRVLPPAAQDDDGEVDPARLKAMVMQLQQQTQEMQQVIAEQADVIRTKQIEANSRIEQTWTKGQIDLILAEVKARLDGEQQTRDNVAAAAADERKAGLTAKSENRRIAADTLKHQRDIDFKRDAQGQELNARRADKTLDASMSFMDANRQDARADRERQENAAQTTQQQQFELARDKQRMAAAPKQPGGAGKKPAGRK